MLTPLAPPLFPPADAPARAALIAWIGQTPLVYGPWQGFKRLYKDAETAYAQGAREPEIMAALLARLDAQSLDETEANAAVAGSYGLIYVREGFAYIVAAGNVLQTFDLSAPAQPQRTATQPLEMSFGYETQFQFTGGYLWLQSGPQLCAFDLADPARPRLIGPFSTRSYLTTLKQGNVVTLVNNAKLRISQLQNEELVEIGGIDLDLGQGYANRLSVEAGVASITFYSYSGRSYQYFTQQVDISDPTNPRLGDCVADSRAGAQRQQFIAAGEYGLAFNNNKLSLYDISDPNKPRELGKINVAGARSVVSDGQIAVVSCYEYSAQGGARQSLRFVDLSRPKSLSLLGELEAAELGHLALVGNLVYAPARDGLHIYDISDPARAQEIGKAPRPETFAYLKRRGRRFLRQLSQTDPAAFCELAAAFFEQIKARQNLNFDIHWIAADLVAAHHPNWYQASHGRGAYLYKPESFVLNRRVERAPQAWDARPATLRALVQSSVTAPVVHLARQICGAQQPLTPAQIESYVSSPWPNLRVLGARAARSLVEAGGALRLGATTANSASASANATGGADEDTESANSTVASNANASNANASNANGQSERASEANASDTNASAGNLSNANGASDANSANAQSATGAVSTATAEAAPRALFAGLSARALAGALFASNARARRELLDAVGTSAALGSELASFLGESAPLERDRFGRRKRVSVLTRRGREVALLLAARFDLSDPAFRADGALPILRALLGAGEAPLRALGAQFCRRLSAEEVLPLIPFAVENAAVAESLLESASRADFAKDAIDRAVRAETPAARALAWQLVEASHTAPATLNAVWMSLLRGLTQQYDWNARTRNWQISAALLGAAGDANARACLVRGALDAREVRPRWSDQFAGEVGGYYANAGVPGEIFGIYALFLPAATVVSTVATLREAKWAEWKTAFAAAIAPHPGVTAAFWSATQEYILAKNPEFEQLRARTFNDPAVAATFAGAAGQLSPNLLLSLIASVPDAVWASWRANLLQVLQTDSARREAFWEAARAQGFGGLLGARLAGDAEFAATFGLLDEVLDFDDPALESLLSLWLEARDLDEATALEAATHPLPQVRALGLAELEKRGLSVPLALRLLESDLRDAMEAAKSWFETRGENIANLALALCDSPRLPVREYGREFVGARLEALLADGLLPKLEENPNAEMQAFVAGLLLERGAESDEQPVEFDRAVLRGRNRARRAKSLVQQRRLEAPLPDDATLLELARGKTPRDAQWALMQLARRAMDGEVEGVEVSGVGAI